MSLSTKIKSSFTKLKKSSTKNKVLVAFFVVGFAGLGIYQVVNSSAASTGYGVASVQVAEMNLAGQLTGINVANANVTLAPNPANTGYTCKQSNTSNPVNTGNTYSSGIAAFTCSSFYGNPGKQYIANASKAGYVSKGSAINTVQIGGTTVFRLILQQVDSDRDGIADVVDTCPAQAGVAPTGCPAGNPTGYGVISVQVAEMDLAGQLTGSNVTNAAVTVSPTPANSAYTCMQTNTSNPANTGNTYSAGIAAFTCASNATGKTYVADASKAGYVSKGSYQGIARIGSTTVLRVILQQKDSDGDGYADIKDGCPSQTGGAPNGCPSDTTPPSTPSGLTGSAIGGGQIKLTWNGSTDNVGVTGYKVKLAGWGTVVTTSSAEKTATLNSATPGNSYTYTVLAIDAAGNVSSASNSVTVVAK